MNDTTKLKKIFMRETLLDVWNYYEKALKNPNFKTWDWIVLTASNEEQAKIYNSEIEYRLNQGVIPKNINYLVLPDPEGKRVGSGGATLNVLAEIKKRDNRDFSELKILTIHSGGDSKRVPQYSVCGKLFSPVQRELPNGKSSSLFDEFLITFSSIANRMKSGMVLLSGDVMLSFNPLQVEFFNLDSAAISIKENVEIGKEHGVFLSNETGELYEFLHKFPVDKLKEKGAVNKTNNVDIDTGAIYLSSNICHDLFSLVCENGNISDDRIKEYINDTVRLSLYGDFLYPLAKNVNFSDYLVQAAEGELNRELKDARKILWDKLSKYKMKVIKTAPSEFVHFGTTKELKDLVTKKIEDYSYLDWKKNILTNNIGNLFVTSNCSFIDRNTVIGENCYIEKSYIGKNCKIGNDVILSNVKISDIEIPSNVCINTLKQLDGTYVSRIYSISDNPKMKKDNNTEFLSQNLVNILDFYGIEDKLLWDSKDNSIWEAKFYKKCISEEESILSALKLYDILNKKVSKDEVDQYFCSDRISLRESFNKCDATCMRKNSEEIEIYVRALNYFDILAEKYDINKANEILLKSPNFDDQINKVLELISTQNYFVKYRTYLSLSIIYKNQKNDIARSAYYEDLCYEEIKKTIGVLEFKLNSKYNIKEKVIVELPIRVNFAGGWSDTPPYCIENGGSVLNGAFMLNGKKPLRVIVKKTNSPKVVLESIDLGSRKEFEDIEDLKNCFNTNDSFSLLKAALIVTGIVKEADQSIEDIINRIGCGFEFITDVAYIPKGSGLGTSSILSAACLKALYEFLGIEISNVNIASKVLEQEQLMGTGGGWQDQIGGLVPGIKLITTRKGKVQDFKIEKIKLSSEMEKLFNEKFVLIYTGQRRLAKNLLRSIMNNYIFGDENVVNSIYKIKMVSKKMTDSLKLSDKQEFIKLLNKHWELSKSLDKGCTNSCIDQILNVCDDLIAAKMICGAGGGGFLQVILKDNVTKKELSNRINEIFQDSGIKVYDVTLVKEEK